MSSPLLSRLLRSDKTVLFTFFPAVILIGSLLLFHPAAYGNPAAMDLSYLDALFTAVSAVCVTGLITVDTAQYTQFGQTVILLLIQIGGLGIISLSTFFLAFPGSRISFKSQKAIKGYYIEMLEVQPKKIVRNIVLMTLGIEAAGALLLYLYFKDSSLDSPLFTAIFHAVSAFCNAGFSVFSNSLENFRDVAPVNIIIMVLIISGGLSFLVFHELWTIAIRKKKASLLSVHSKAVLSTTLVLIVTGFILFMLLEPGFSPLAALFQSVSPRTAGFNSVPQADLSTPSTLLTMFLMLIGGAPGSIAGGIKVTTLFLLFIMIVRKPLENGSIVLFKRSLSASMLAGAAQFLVKALALLFVATLALTISEGHSLLAQPGEYQASFIDIMFESISAFGTAGLSRGLTAYLSVPGKIIIMLTMFAGRIGLISMAMPVKRKIEETLIQYPEGEVMIG